MSPRRGRSSLGKPTDLSSIRPLPLLERDAEPHFPRHPTSRTGCPHSTKTSGPDRDLRGHLRQRPDGVRGRALPNRVHPHHRLPPRPMPVDRRLRIRHRLLGRLVHNQRLHPSLGMTSPTEYEQAHDATLSREQLARTGVAEDFGALQPARGRCWRVREWVSRLTEAPRRLWTRIDVRRSPFHFRRSARGSCARQAHCRYISHEISAAARHRRCVSLHP